MSLVATAEACGKKPAAYLTDVLLRIQHHPMGRIDALLHHKWTAPQEASAETAQMVLGSHTYYARRIDE